MSSGATIGNYTIRHLLGAGGMGEVYLAQDNRLDRPVALKLLAADTSIDADRRRRFEREAKLAAALRHPHICTIFEIGDDGGRPFIAMELVEGVTLQQRLQAGPMGVDEVVRIAVQITDALDEARRQHVVHRDLKSANIILTPRGDVKILDFGLATRADGPVAHEETTAAAITESGLVVGTLAYMSPEQALGRPVDHRSDLFSLGVVLYQMLTNRLPFAGATSTQLLNAVVNGQQEPLKRLNAGVPDALVNVVDKLLTKDPENRYQLARDVATDLRRVLTGATAVPSRGRRWLRPAIAGVVVAAGVVLWQFWPSKSEVPSGTTILVLPAEVEGDADARYMEEGVANTLSQHLAAIDGLVVLSSPDRKEWNLHGRNVQAAATEYGAALVVTSMARASGGRLHLSLKLTEAGTNRFRWGRDFDGTAADYLRFLTEAAAEIRGEIRPASSRSEPVRATSSNAAQVAYDRGSELLNLYDMDHDATVFDLALARFQEALQQDPAFADAAAQIARLYLDRADVAELTERRGLTAKAKQWAERAIALDDRCGLGHAALAATQNSFGDLRTRIRHALLGAKFAPRAPYAHLMVQTVSHSAELGLHAAREMIRLNPYYLNGPNAVIDNLHILGKYDEAIAEGQKLLQIEPRGFFRWTMLQILINSGRTAEARRLFAELASSEMPDFIAAMEQSKLASLDANDTSASALRARVVGFAADPNLTSLDLYNLISDQLPFLSKQGYLEDAVKLATTALGRGVVPFYDAWSSNPDLAALRARPEARPVEEQSRAVFLVVVEELAAADSRGELPVYLKQPLQEVRRKLGL